MNFSSRRSNVIAKNGAVATSQPLAAQAGLEILKKGGNAVDAAVATAAVLNVVEPMSTGIGGDVFALVRNSKDKIVKAMNGSGRSGSNANPNFLKQKGYDSIPKSGIEGIYSVSVPGTVHGWETLLKDEGNMNLKDVLKPAIKYAFEGFGVSEKIANSWKASVEKISVNGSNEFLPLGKAPKVGSLLKLQELGETLTKISEKGAKEFYQGDIGNKIIKFVESLGGWISKEDLLNHTTDWVEPIHTKYRDVSIWECPPNGQGIAALIALNIIENFNMSEFGFQTAETFHHSIEAMRLAFADSLQYVTDTDTNYVPVNELISKDYAKARSKLIKHDQRINDVSFGNPFNYSDTVYISVIDGEGNACSLINSLYESFGSGLLVPGTGIFLQNRGSLFSLENNHPNYLSPKKRPYHTIIPAIATKDEELWLSFGVMGGFQQPQGHLQVVMNMVDFDLKPQQSLDAPRFRVDLDSDYVWLEDQLHEKISKTLKNFGHPIKVMSEGMQFGGGQILERKFDSGLIIGGSDSRKDGCVVGW
ncbi:MAG: gamma-glutamyltransferase [Chloroflexi bacterium]|nr:gamma-glutamyltransferase [Chloroflexota bacterium]